MFKFDEVFGESCDNQGVYNHTVKPLIQFVFNRYSIKMPVYLDNFVKK